MPTRAAALLLLLLALPAGAQSTAERVEAAIADGDRLRAEGRLAAALERLRGAATLSLAEVEPALRERLEVAEDAVLAAAAAAWTRGEDAGLGEPVALHRLLLERLASLDAPARRRPYLEDPAFEALRRVPAVRHLLATRWRLPHHVVWPDLRVTTRDPRFDFVLDLAVHEARLRPGASSIAREWLAAPQPATPGAAWTFRWQCALLAPAEQGSFPSSAAFLRDPAKVAPILAEVAREAGDAPWGFEALRLLNLTIAAGDLARAAHLAARLGQAGGVLEDLGLASALALARALAPDAPLVARLEARLLGGAVPDEARPTGPVRDALDDVLALSRTGRHREARARLGLAWDLAEAAPVSSELVIDLRLGELEAIAAAAAAYGRGEEAGWLTADELAARGLSDAAPRRRGAKLLLPALAGVCAGPLPDPELRDRLRAEPGLAPLRATPLLRMTLHAWGEPSARVWPGRPLETGDAEFDRLFADASALSPQPGFLPPAVATWLAREKARATGWADVWSFRWRCALIAPVGEGGWPLRMSLLADPQALAEALRDLEARAGPEPAGFQALVQVNLHIASGQHERARALLARLAREGGPLYDAAVAKALSFALGVERAGKAGPGLGALLDELGLHACGLHAPPP